MKHTFKTIIAGSVLAIATQTASAMPTTQVFDTGTETSGLQLNYLDFNVTAGISVNNLFFGVDFVKSVDIYNNNNVLAYQDTIPANGGLGVTSNVLVGDTDNLEGSSGLDLDGDGADDNGDVEDNDEILFFNFNSGSSLISALLNGGAGTSHQDGFGTNSDRFGMWWSNDGENYTNVLSGIGGNNLAPTDSGAGVIELITNPMAMIPSAMYWAIAHVGPPSSVGGYIESITYRVPAPAPLALFGLALAALGFASRKKAK